MVQAQFIESEQNFLEDITFVALNQLPSRNLRYDIDMAYPIAKEQAQIEYEDHKAVTAAVEYVKQHRNDRANSA